jgi:hypothetical protein
VESETRQARLLRQSPPSRPPAFHVPRRVKAGDAVVNHLLAAEGELGDEGGKNIVRRFHSSKTFRPLAHPPTEKRVCKIFHLDSRHVSAWNAIFAPLDRTCSFVPIGARSLELQMRGYRRMNKKLCVAAILFALIVSAGHHSSAAPIKTFSYPVVVATGRLVNQTAPIQPTTILTPNQDGIYRLSVYGTLTRADALQATLSGTSARLGMMRPDRRTQIQYSEVSQTSKDSLVRMIFSEALADLPLCLKLRRRRQSRTALAAHRTTVSIRCTMPSND